MHRNKVISFAQVAVPAETARWPSFAPRQSTLEEQAWRNSPLHLFYQYTAANLFAGSSARSYRNAEAGAARIAPLLWFRDWNSGTARSNDAHCSLSYEMLVYLSCNSRIMSCDVKLRDTLQALCMRSVNRSLGRKD